MYQDHEDRRAEERMIDAARRNGLVQCPHCGRMVESEMLGVTCETCGAAGCKRCVVPVPGGLWVCADEAECLEAVAE